MRDDNRCDDPQHMKFPVPCSECGRWVELHEMAFPHQEGNVATSDGGTYGLCPDCAREERE